MIYLEAVAMTIMPRRARATKTLRRLEIRPLFIKKRKLRRIVYSQGGKIWRSFAYWSIVYFGQFFSPHFWTTFSLGKCCLAKYRLGQILGEFFITSSGHPELTATTFSSE
jgi:hypothetical protein